jgi:hypothetical protein
VDIPAPKLALAPIPLLHTAAPIVLDLRHSRIQTHLAQSMAPVQQPTIPVLPALVQAM